MARPTSSSLTLMVQLQVDAVAIFSLSLFLLFSMLTGMPTFPHFALKMHCVICTGLFAA